VSLIALEDDCNPADLAGDDLSNGTASRGAAPAQLTHLNFLPVTPEQGDGSVPTVQAIFCKPPNPISYDLNPQETRYSIIVKWEVHQEQHSQLHSSLDQVTSKKKSVSSVSAQNTFLLKRQSDFSLHAVVLGFYPIWYNMLLAFAYSDGAIEFRKRSTMEIIMPDDNTDTVSSLLQAGFVFQHAEPSLHVALSPNHCMAVCMQLDGSPKLRFMEYSHGTLSSDDDDPRHSAALAAVILQSSSAANQYYSSDDIFAVVSSLNEKRKRDFVNLLFEGLQINIDCGVDDQSSNHFLLLGRGAYFVKTLSAMNLLGLQGNVERSLISKLAWQIINIRFVTQTLTTIFRMHGDISKNNLKPEGVPQMIGTCRWAMHFMAYIFDELFTLGRALSDIPTAELTRPILEAKIQELNKPALLLILSAFPRAMMKLWGQPIQWVKRSAEAYIKPPANTANPNAPPQTPEAKKLYTPLYTAVSEVPFEYRWFEVLLSETQNHVRGIYQNRALTDMQRNTVERELLLGKIPDILFPAAKRLVTDQLWNSKQPGGCLADKLDMGKLMFFDTTWLGFQDSKRARHWHDTHVVDVCQKMIIRGTGTWTHPVGSATSAQNRARSDSIQSAGANGDAGAERKRKNLLRQCTRCGACMEDVVPGLPGYTALHYQYLLGVSKHCICGNSWMLVETKGKAK
jgi:mediator of RNA polymerase II transcription subunit 16